MASIAMSNDQSWHSHSFTMFDTCWWNSPDVPIFPLVLSIIHPLLLDILQYSLTVMKPIFQTITKLVLNYYSLSTTLEKYHQLYVYGLSHKYNYMVDKRLLISHKLWTRWYIGHQPDICHPPAKEVGSLSVLVRRADPEGHGWRGLVINGIMVNHGE